MPVINSTLCQLSKTIKLSLIIAIVNFLTACSPTPTQLNVQLMWHDKPLECGAVLVDRWQLNQIQFYLSEFSINNKPINLATSNDINHQQKNIVLLGGDCQTAGNWTIYFDSLIPKGKLVFEIGVPFNANHSNPLKALSPLNQSDMFWTWQQGHKFLRTDFSKTDTNNTSSANMNTGWQFHLGSVGCQSASVMRSPKQACEYPNRAKFEIDYNNESLLLFDIAPLFEPILSQTISSKTSITEQSCMSDPNSLSCQHLFKVLGLSSQSATITQHQASSNSPLWKLKND